MQVTKTRIAVNALHLNSVERSSQNRYLGRALSSISLLVELCDHIYSYLFVSDALITHFVFRPGLERHVYIIVVLVAFFNSGKAFTSSLSILSSVFQTQTPASFDETRMFLMEKPNT